ncbi:MAG TPA: hypothetical protein DCX32_04865 [Candidatus Moranbacteria bacterium]|nr:MAG: hypothetical protein UW87_C0018G0013 [Candidatus Moranbacteria bacterium GW2011_GWC2_45_10]HAV11838.1 hypothetical protein [Candidatus Moranbacteria bacterium]
MSTLSSNRKESVMVKLALLLAQVFVPVFVGINAVLWWKNSGIIAYVLLNGTAVLFLSGISFLFIRQIDKIARTNGQSRENIARLLLEYGKDKSKERPCFNDYVARRVQDNS